MQIPLRIQILPTVNIYYCFLNAVWFISCHPRKKPGHMVTTSQLKLEQVMLLRF